MSTNNTENLGFKVLTMGREEFDARKPCNLRPLTLDKLLAWIDSKRLDSRLKEELKKSASTYPQQALSTWQKMYHKHLAKAQNTLQDKPAPPSPVSVVELGDEPYKKADDYEEENSIPDNDFDAGWENPRKDQA